MVISRSLRAARADIVRVPGTAVGRYGGSWAHLVGCAAAGGVLLVGARFRLLAGPAFGWPRLGLVLAELVAWTGVAGAWVVVARRLRRPPPPPPPPPPPRVPEFMYLNVRRVNDSLAFLHLSLAQQTTVTQGRTIAGGVEVKGDLLGMGLSGVARREVAEQISQIHLLGDLDRYLKLHDLLKVREVPDGSRRTLEQQTFWEFPLVGVDVPVPDPDADALHAVGRLDRLDLPVWFRIDNEWRRQPVREFRGTLTVVAQAVEEPPPADLEPFLQGGDGPAALRLRPLAIHR